MAVQMDWMSGGYKALRFILEEQLARYNNVDVTTVVILFHNGVFGIESCVVEIEDGWGRKIKPRLLVSVQF